MRIPLKNIQIYSSMCDLTWDISKAYETAIIINYRIICQDNVLSELNAAVSCGPNRLNDK